MIRILIIDDDITSLDIISFLFEEKGYEVKRCADGFSALEYLKAETPDLVIADLMMPGLNGVETIRQIRGMGLDVPIIAFTAVDEPGLHNEALEVGCNRVLTKPCNSAKLIENIKSLLPTQT